MVAVLVQDLPLCHLRLRRGTCICINSDMQLSTQNKKNPTRQPLFTSRKPLEEISASTLYTIATPMFSKAIHATVFVSSKTLHAELDLLLLTCCHPSVCYLTLAAPAGHVAERTCRMAL